MTLDSLYRSILVEHYKHPRNFGRLAEPTHCTRQHNPLCGDHIELHLLCSVDDRIQAVKFQGRGCVISQASASMMTEAVAGKSVARARALIVSFQNLLFRSPAETELLELVVFAALQDFPSRIPCATLAWQALAVCLSTPEKKYAPPPGLKT